MKTHLLVAHLCVLTGFLLYGLARKIPGPDPGLAAAEQRGWTARCALAEKQRGGEVMDMFDQRYLQPEMLYPRDDKRFRLYQMWDTNCAVQCHAYMKPVITVVQGGWLVRFEDHYPKGWKGVK